MTTRSSMSVNPFSSSRSLRSIQVLLGLDGLAGILDRLRCRSPADSML
jgi:hypothetical protein